MAGRPPPGPPGAPAPRRGGGEPPSTRLRPHAFKVLAPDSLVGGLLGARSGATNQKDEIQNDTGARLILSNRDEHYPNSKLRTVIVHADEPQQVMHALDRLVEKTVECAATERENPRGQPDFVGRGPGEIVFRVAVPRFMSEVLIGMHGVCLGQLQHESGAEVIADRDAYVGHIMLRIFGVPAMVRNALEKLLMALDRSSSQEAFHSWAAVRTFASSAHAEADPCAASAADAYGRGPGGPPGFAGHGGGGGPDGHRAPSDRGGGDHRDDPRGRGPLGQAGDRDRDRERDRDRGDRRADDRRPDDRRHDDRRGDDRRGDDRRGDDRRGDDRRGDDRRGDDRRGDDRRHDDRRGDDRRHDDRRGDDRRGDDRRGDDRRGDDRRGGDRRGDDHVPRGLPPAGLPPPPAGLPPQMLPPHVLLPPAGLPPPGLPPQMMPPQMLPPQGMPPPPPRTDWRVHPNIEAMSVIADEFIPGGLENDFSVSCDLPDKRCGALIGKRGEYVDFVERVTGARVKFDGEAGASKNGMRTMSVIGKLLSVYMAHMLMMKRYLDDEVPDGFQSAAPDRLRARLEEMQGLFRAAPVPAPAPARRPSPPREERAPPGPPSIARDSENFYDVEALRRLKRRAEDAGYLDLDHARRQVSRSHGGGGGDRHPSRSEGHRRSRSRRERRRSPSGARRGGHSPEKGRPAPEMHSRSVAPSTRGPSAGGGEAAPRFAGALPDPTFSVESEAGKHRCALTVWAPPRGHGQEPRNFQMRGPKRDDLEVANADGARMMQAFREGGESEARRMQRTLQELSKQEFVPKGAPDRQDQEPRGEGYPDAMEGVQEEYEMSEEGYPEESQCQEGAYDPEPYGRESYAQESYGDGAYPGETYRQEANHQEATHSFLEELFGSQPAEIREEDDLVVRTWGDGIPGPVGDWDEAMQQGCLAPAVLQSLGTMGFSSPLIAQRYAMPIIASQQYDLLVEAPPGFGKTFAYLLPLVSRLVGAPAPARPHVPGPSAQASPLLLFFAPTRELAVQTGAKIREVLKAARGTGSVLVLYDGEALSVQTKPIERQQFDVVCATPGRLLEVLNAGKLSLAFVTTVVLDEAEQLWHQQEMEAAVGDALGGRDLPAEGRQTLLFSSALPPQLPPSVRSWLRPSPELAGVRISPRSLEGAAGFGGAEASSAVEQRLAWVTSDQERWGRVGQDLAGLISESEPARRRAIVFASRVIQATALVNVLKKPPYSFRCARANGKLAQDMQDEAIKSFNSGEAEVLVATDLQGQGLDFRDVGVVLQADFPPDIAVYAERAGCAGRDGMPGKSLAYLGPKDAPLAPALLEHLLRQNQAVPQWLHDLASGSATLAAGEH